LLADSSGVCGGSSRRGLETGDGERARSARHGGEIPGGRACARGIPRDPRARDPRARDPRQVVVGGRGGGRPSARRGVGERPSARRGVGERPSARGWSGRARAAGSAGGMSG
jgi:hypothetical protein